jgi:3-methyladenine DNA glycosylase AlkD
MLDDLKNEIKALRDTEKSIFLARFFKTGKGEYSEGDTFYGFTVPESRRLASKYKELPLRNVLKLLKSKIHEARLIALFILVTKFKKGDEKTKEEIYKAYLANTKYINNWDLVDSSADKIVGAYLMNNRPRTILEKLAKSDSLWERRIAIIATFQFIKNHEYEETFKIAKLLLNDKHDLIHKAVGWMLREVGKKMGADIEKEFLNKNYKAMPRTMLRYAIERFPQGERLKYLNGEI